MNWWLAHNFETKKPYLEARMRIIKAIRSYFDAQNFWEVETPILQVCPVMDTHIHAFKTELLGLDLKKERDFYLHTSPEFAMKKLMVAGVLHLYQICHVFRNGEGSRLHSPEFTMIEWYRSNSDYTALMDDCIGLVRHCAESLGTKTLSIDDKTCDPFREWQKISLCEAFDHFANVDLKAVLEDVEAFRAATDIRTTDGDTWDDVFHAIMAEKIEPYLGQGIPTILYDYPVSMASLSRKKPDDPRFAERFELYICGVELANAFSELTDPVEQRTRFIEEMDIKEKLYGERYPIDEDFLNALEHGLPESAGIALGIDRLVMLLTGANDIDQVLWTGKL